MPPNRTLPEWAKGLERSIESVPVLTGGIWMHLAKRAGIFAEVDIPPIQQPLDGGGARRTGLYSKVLRLPPDSAATAGFRGKKGLSKDPL